MLRIAALIGLVAVSACATPDAATMQAATPLQLCQTYAMAKNTYAPDWLNASIDELKRRGSLSKQELSDISRQRMRTGMSEHAAVCSWGPYVDVNTTTGSWGVHRQYVMGQFGPYVYTENGRVTSWQN